MGSSSVKPSRTVKLVIDGLDEFDVRLDNAETKFDDIAKKAPAKKKAVK